MTKEIAEQRDTEIVPVQVGRLSPIEQMTQMKQMGLEVADMREMLALQKEYEANEALKQYNISLAAFKSEEITILKDKHVSYKNRAGDLTEYDHASLSNILETAVPLLSRHGFSHRWLTDQAESLIKVTCILTHRMGHSEQTSLKSASDTSGGKNSIQAIASAVKYLERYTFLALTGLSEKDKFDDDGMSAAPEDAITTDQETVLIDLIKETKADEAKFLEYMKCATLGEMPASLFTRAKRALEAKKKA